MTTKTDIFNFNLIDLNKIPWHELNHDNWRMVDSILSQYIAIINLKGVWDNSLVVAVGDKYVDRELGSIHTALIAHTSNTSGTFAEDRDAIPTRWEVFTSIEATYIGAWATGQVYAQNGFVIDSDRYGVTTSNYTSSSSYDVDVTNGSIITLIDVSAATASAAAALASETAAAVSAASIALPSFVSLNLIRSNVGATAWENITPANLLTAISGQPLDTTLTNIAALTGLTDNTLLRADSTVGLYQDSGWTLADTTDLLTAAGNLQMADNEILRPLLSDVGEKTNFIGNSGTGPIAVDFTDGHYQTLTVTGAFTISFTNFPESTIAGGLTLELTNGESSAITWPAEVKWAGNVLPTFSTTGVDIITFVTRDKATGSLHAFVSGLDMS